MLIKSTRIRTTVGAEPLVRHLLDGDDNEAVSVFQGTVQDLRDAVADAKQFGRTYALRHWIVAPEIEIDREQFNRALEVLANEFGFSTEIPLIVEHQKSRSVSGVAGTHWHIVMPETDPSNGRVLSSRHDRARHEKIARMLEIEFDHPVVQGAHNKAVLTALHQEGHTDLVARLTDQLSLGDRPVEAFTTKAHQMSKRAGFDLATLKRHVATAWADTGTASRFVERLMEHGMRLETGDKDGVWVIRTATGTFLGSGHRLTRMRRADFAKHMENFTNEHQSSADRSTSDPSGNPSDPSKYGDNPCTGRDRRIANERGEGLIRSDHAGPVGDGHFGDRSQSAIARSAPPEIRSTWNRDGGAAYDGRGLITAAQEAGARLKSLTRSDVGLSPSQHAEHYLAGLERQARGEIAATQAQAQPNFEKRIAAAVLYREGATARYDALLAEYRSVEEQLAAPPARHSLMDRFMGHRTPALDREMLERTHAALRKELANAERTMTAAIAGVQRTERDAAGAKFAHSKAIEGLTSEMSRRLEGIAHARRVVSAFPFAVYSGPVFLVWAGQKISRARRKSELRNPSAKNIWGLPIDFGN